MTCNLRIFLGLLFALLVFSSTCEAAAADTACSFKDAKVTKVSTKSPQAADFAVDRTVQLKDHVKFEIAGLGTSPADVACGKKIVLFVSGKPVTDAQAAFEPKATSQAPAPKAAGTKEPAAKTPPNSKATSRRPPGKGPALKTPSEAPAKELVFVLRPTKASADLWRLILGSPSFSTKTVDVGVGLPDGPRISAPEAKTELKLATLDNDWFYFWCVLLVALLGLFFVLGARSSILRDTILATDVPGKKTAFSLAKTQAAVWFFLVLTAYLLIGIVTGDFSSSLNGTAVTLLGIGAGTALGAAVIDASKRPKHESEKKAKEAEIAPKLIDVEIQRHAAATAAREANSARKELWSPSFLVQAALKNRQAFWDKKEEVVKAMVSVKKQNLELAKMQTEHAAEIDQEAALNGTSQNFIFDILSDANGISFHRFQMVAWTIVLGVIFVAQVYEDMAMPTFSPTLMGLLGISAGTFLGLKIPEATVPNKTMP